MDDLTARTMRNIEDLLLKNFPRQFMIAAKDAILDADGRANRECMSFIRQASGLPKQVMQNTDV